MIRVDDATAFDAALLAEVARLLPSVDVVHNVERQAPVVDVPVAVARRRVGNAARRAAEHAVAAWSAVFPDIVSPGHVAVDLAVVAGGRVAVTATAVQREVAGPAHRLDASMVADALGGLGWDARQRTAAGEATVNVLGVRPGLRLDATARHPSPVGLRVTHEPIDVGAFAAPLARQPRRVVPWPATR